MKRILSGLLFLHERGRFIDYDNPEENGLRIHLRVIPGYMHFCFSDTYVTYRMYNNLQTQLYKVREQLSVEIERSLLRIIKLAIQDKI